MPTNATAGSLRLMSTETAQAITKAIAHIIMAGIGSFFARDRR